MRSKSPLPQVPSGARRRQCDRPTAADGPPRFHNYPPLKSRKSLC